MSGFNHFLPLGKIGKKIPQDTEVILTSWGHIRSKTYLLITFRLPE